jgi:hypothetical protein
MDTCKPYKRANLSAGWFRRACHEIDINKITTVEQAQKFTTGLPEPSAPCVGMA